MKNHIILFCNGFLVNIEINIANRLNLKARGDLSVDMYWRVIVADSLNSVEKMKSN